MPHILDEPGKERENSAETDTPEKPLYSPTCLTRTSGKPPCKTQDGFHLRIVSYIAKPYLYAGSNPAQRGAARGASKSAEETATNGSAASHSKQAENVWFHI